jgi:hypothetical protein
MGGMLWLVGCCCCGQTEEEEKVYLISKGVPSNDDGLFPARNQEWHILAENWLTKHSTSKDISNGAIRRLPHLLELELFNSGLIRRDSGALNPNIVLPNGIRSIHSNLVIGFVTVLHSQIIVLDVKINKWQDQLTKFSFQSNFQSRRRRKSSKERSMDCSERA